MKSRLGPTDRGGTREREGDGGREREHQIRTGRGIKQWDYKEPPGKKKCRSSKIIPKSTMRNSERSVLSRIKKKWPLTEHPGVQLEWNSFKSMFPGACSTRSLRRVIGLQCFGEPSLPLTAVNCTAKSQPIVQSSVIKTFLQHLGKFASS